MELPDYAWLRERLESAEGRAQVAKTRELAALARELGASVAQLAIAWCVTNKNVSTVIQAYLRRSAEDMRALAQEGAHIRLCKGAYLESPEHAFSDKPDADANYTKIMHAFLQTSGYLCIATHDEKMIQAAENDIKTLKPTRYEFQMLYGIRPMRQDELAAAGYPVRVYVPFGAAWYPYFMRRLAERPANVWFFARSIFRR